MATVCIITPGQLATNPRVVKEASALSEAGHTVKLVVCNFSRWARPLEKEVETDLGGAEVVARIPFGPGTPLPLRIRQVVRQRMAHMMLKKGMTGLALAVRAHHPASVELIRAAQKVQADLYIAHYVAALPAAAAAARKHGARYAFDAEDFHLGELPDGPAHDVPRRIIRTIEEHFLPEAAYVTAASPGIADAYAQTYGIERPTVILNVFPLREAPSAPTPKGSVQPGPSVYWFSQTIGPDRGLECAVRALALARSKPHLYLRGTPAAGYREKLEKLARQCGVADRLHFLPPAPPSEMVRLAAQYDLGFSGEPGFSQNNRLALGNKIFTYFMAGIPVVLSDIPAHRDFAESLEPAAVLFANGQPDSLAKRLDLFLTDKIFLKKSREHSIKLSQMTFNWENEKEILKETIKSCLK